jgi:hypothetical protein
MIVHQQRRIAVTWRTGLATSREISIEFPRGVSRQRYET